MFYSNSIEIYKKVEYIMGISTLSFLSGLVLVNVSSTPQEPYFSLKNVFTMRQMATTSFSFIFLYRLH